MIDIKEFKMEMETITKGGKPKRIKVRVNPESIRMPQSRAKADPVVCPRSAEDVYLLGISLQNYIASLYLELSEMNKNNKKNYANQVVTQIVVKKEIEKLAKDNLNQLLAYFYENGGPIIEPPVSEETANELQPSINLIVTAFLNQIDLILDKASQGDMNSNDLDNEINNQINFMLTAMSKLIKNDVMQNAFDELISLRKM